MWWILIQNREYIIPYINKIGFMDYCQNFPTSINYYYYYY